MSITISRIIQALEPSATLAMAAKAKELKAAGQTIYDLSVGEPDFITPAHICRAAEEAMRAGHTKYTIASGIPELKKAVVEQYRARHGLSYAPGQVVVANGAKHALHNAFTVLLDPGDEVIIPAPYWVSYAELVKLTGAVPVIVATRQEDNFKLTPAQLRQAATGQDEDVALVQSVESDRQHVLAGGTRRAGRRGGREEPAGGGRRDLRAAGLRRASLRQLRHGAAGPGRADGPGQRRQQDLRDDRLADRLDAGAAGGVAGDGRPAEPGDARTRAASANMRRWPP